MARRTTITEEQAKEVWEQAVKDLSNEDLIEAVRLASHFSEGSVVRQALAGELASRGPAAFEPATEK